jgi:hypothetical protein
MVSGCDIANEFGKCGGTKACGADGKFGACLGKTPAAETCNGVDDNCNGQTDEGLTQTCSSACGAGVETCQNGQWAACSAPQPATEVCDNKDNDCDGQTDEGFGQITCGTGDCAVTVNACERGSVQTCQPQAGKACDDGSPCTENDACTSGGICSGTLKECGDADECTADSCDAATGECRHEQVAECGKKEEGPPAMPAGNSKIFDLPAARAIKLPGRPTDVKVIDNGEQQIVLISYCNGGSCGMVTLHMKDFQRKVDAVAGVAKGEEEQPQFAEDAMAAGKKLAGVASVVSEGVDDFVMFDDKCVTIIPKKFQQMTDKGKAGAEKKEEVKTDICMQDHGACADHKINYVEVKGADIKVKVECPDGTGQSIVLKSEKKGEFVSSVETAEGENMVEPGKGMAKESPEEEAFKGKITEKFGAGFGKQAKGFAVANFLPAAPGAGKSAGGKPLAIITAGGLYSIRAGEAALLEGKTVEEADEHPENISDIVSLYPEGEENYLCDSAVDNVHSTDDEKLIQPQFFNIVSMKDYGGPDLMAVCQKAAGGDVVKAEAGEEVPAKEYIAFFYPNLNEAPEAGEIEAGAASAEGAAVLKANFTDPTDDVLTYTWTCTDAVGADCAGELSAVTGGTVSVNTIAAGEAGAEKAVTGGFNYPYAVKVTGTDAGGLSDTAELSIDSTGKAKAVGTAEGPAEPVAPAESGSGWAFLAGGGWACSLVIEGEEGTEADMKFVIVIPALIGIAVFLFVAARLNRMRVKSSCHSRSRGDDRLNN